MRTAGVNDEIRETAVVGTTVMAVVLAAVYWISRVGFDNPAPPVLAALGLSLFLIATPLWLARIMRRVSSTAWWTSLPVVSLLCIALTVGAGIVSGRTGVSAALPFAIVGFVLAGITCVRWATSPTASLKSSLLFIAGAIVFAVWCAGVVWGSRYKMPLFWEALAFKANIHHDTFYYASMANMLETYGVPSTGIDGVPVIRYHFGSPWVFAKWSDLLGTDVLSFYSLGYPIVVMPLFFCSLLTLSAGLRDEFANLDARPLRSDPRAWLIFFAATVGFIPTVALDGLAVWNSNAFISESYLIGMSVFFLLAGAGIAFRRPLLEMTRIAGAEAFTFLMLFAPLMLAGLGLLKISLMLLAFGAALYLVLRLRLYRRMIVLVSLVVSAIAVGLTYLLVSVPAHNTGLSPLHFMRFDTADGWQQFFPLVHFLWTWVYLGVRAWEEGVRDFASLGAALRDNRLIDAEALAVIAVLGFLPAEVVAIHGGSGVYFSDVQRWLALSFIVGRIGQMTWKFSVGRAGAQDGMRSVRLSTLLLAIVAAPFVATLMVNLAQWPGRVLKANVALRRELATEPSAYQPIVTALRDIARLPDEQRRRSLLVIPHSSSQYWSMLTADGRCSFTPMIAPAIASVAMLDGTPPPTCDVTDQYNLEVYPTRARPQTSHDVTDQSLCEKARVKGFDHLIVLEAAEGQMPRRRRVDCYLH
jgi:hypothetical protein